MIIGIDNITPGASTSSSATVGGMRPYLADLLEGIPPMFPEWRFLLFTPQWNEPFTAKHPNLATVVVPSPRHRVGRVLYEQAALPQLIHSRGVDLWLGTCNYLPLQVRTRTMLLVQSHQFFTNPEAFGRVRGAWLRAVVRRSVRQADLVGVQCKAAGETLGRFTGIGPGRLRVIFNRTPALPNHDFDIWPLIGGPCEYLVYVSAFYPFKNHARLVDAFGRIKHLRPGLKLVLAGSHENRLCAADPDVIITGRVPDAAISALYRNALASVFPSLEETFGLPVLEAMSLGCPVITSSRSSMAELGADAALLADPEDPAAIAAAMARVLEDEPLRQDLARCGRLRAAQFTRERTLTCLAGGLREAAAPVPPSVAYNTFGGSSLSNGSPGYTGTDFHLLPGPPPVRPEKAA